jgi:outer membrane protein OmpA-like peptidoglycan-associated protein
MSIGVLIAQDANPTRETTRVLTPEDTGQPMPVFRVDVVSRTIRAVNYHHRSGGTKIDFRGTDLMPEARGEAKVESRMGSTKIDTQVEGLDPAGRFGPEFLTYVLWAITPEGRAQNIGELALDGKKSKLLSTTELQAFGLMVTAEPYFAVTQPSDVVVMENYVRDDTTGTMQYVDARYQLLKRGSYTRNRTDYPAVRIDPKGPLQLAEAENAVQIAQLAGAARYAPETYNKAVTNLTNARGFLHGDNKDRKRSETSAREAAQMAEDARLITMRKIEEERVAAERAAAAEREAAARAQADAEARRRAEAEADRAAAEKARHDAEIAALRAQKEKSEAEALRAAALARQQAERAEAQARQEAERAAAEAARAKILAEQQAAHAETERARLAAEEANRARQLAESERQRAEAEKLELRNRLQQQLSTILETRQTARGLIVSMPDVLFDTARYTLKPEAREKLARVSGILSSYPDLTVEIEGHTDSVGSEEYNQQLSERRAQTVRDYLSQQGVPSSTLVAAVGFGENAPAYSNDTSAGRQRNRRVELVVSGESISAR